MSQQDRRRAVVLGNSMAGLLAARVLAESFDEVVIVDRDELTDVSTARRGVPQGRHVHGLLARGQEILEELFPGFTAGAIADGIPTGDLGELRWYFGSGRLQPATTGLVCISATRPLLEALVRARVSVLPNIVQIERADIVGITSSEDKTQVTGALIQRAGEETAETLQADLVVDATGRGSRSPAWLAELGYAKPAEDKVKVNVSYTSRIFRLRDESVMNGDLSINPVATPATPRGAFMSQIEDGKVAVSLYGVLGDSAPTDPDGFMDFAKSLHVPDIHEALADAEPVTDAVTIRYAASVRRRYERLTEFPGGFVVLGDAVCSFNPVYGQGMTVAALEAMTLREQLEQGPLDAKSFFRAITKVVDVCWEMSTSGDLAYPGIEGQPNVAGRLANAYVGQLHLGATQDGELTKRFMQVAGMTAPPTTLMKPSTMLRVAKAVRAARAAKAAEAAAGQTA